MRFSSAVAGLSLLVLGACAPADADPAEGSAEAPAATSPAADTTLFAGTPAGGMEQWIGEIRAGVDSLPELAERDPAAAKNLALTLYVSRQEYVELYYGTTARAARDAELNEAVMTAEARFHDLLRVVNTPEGAIDTAALEAAGSALSEQYEVVLERARALGIDTSRLVLAGGAS